MNNEKIREQKDAMQDFVNRVEKLAEAYIKEYPEEAGKIKAMAQNASEQAEEVFESGEYNPGKHPEFDAFLHALNFVKENDMSKAVKELHKKLEEAGNTLYQNLPGANN